MDRIVFVIGGALLASALLIDMNTGESDADTVAADVGAVPGADQPIAASTNQQFTTMRAPDGHFYAEARIDDRPLRMLIDTGATMVVLNRADAERIGLSASDSEFTAQARTAGGIVRLKPVTLGRMTVGSLIVDNVPAMIAEEPMAVSLIGQSFLSRVGSVEIAGDQIRMR